MALLSLRAALERFPRQIRLFVAFLALICVVAPNWHLCEMGGVASHSGAHPDEHQNRFQTDKNGELVCFCAPHQEKTPGNWAKWAATPTHEHGFCLAQLLQNFAAVPASFPTFQIIEIERSPSFAIRPTQFRAASVRLFSSRAPPQNL